MQLEFLFLGKTKDKYLAQGIDGYSKRLNHYTRATLKVLKEGQNRHLNDADRCVAEGRMLLANLAPGNFVVALDSRGKQFSSEAVADLVTGWENRGIRTVSFLIGGPAGLSDKVVERADLLLSLSKMTFTHDMTRLILLEQFYRAYTIKAGEKYHK